jgi:hypothetical protein
MKCDSRGLVLACTLASLCLGCEPKAKVVTQPATFHAITTLAVEWGHFNFKKGMMMMMMIKGILG